MIAATNLSDWPLVGRLGWALIHSLWQAVLVAAVLALLLRLLRGRSANARYLAAYAALLALVGLPLVTFVTEGTGPAGAGLAASASYLSSDSSSYKVRKGRAFLPSRADTAPEQDVSLREVLRPALPWLVGAWAAGVGLLSLRLLVGGGQVRRLRRELNHPLPDPWPTRLAELSQRLGVRRAVGLVESALVEVPVVLGWLRPVILLPASALTGLTPDQLAAILAHELAHVRRHDYLANLVQTVVETLLFYHPAARWVSTQVRQERENCCDDLAVAACGNRLLYARALARLEEVRDDVPALAGRLRLAADGGALLPRIRRLVGAPTGRPTRWQAGLVVLAALLAGGGALALSVPTSPPEDTITDQKKEEAAANPLRITIARGKADAKGAIPLTITYTNHTDKPIRLTAGALSDNPGFPGETFEVTGDGVRGSYTIHGVDPAIQSQGIAAGKSWVRTIPDLAALLAKGSIGAEGDLPPVPLEAPGTYQVTLRYQCQAKWDKDAFQGPARSNTIQLIVKPASE